MDGPTNTTETRIALVEQRVTDFGDILSRLDNTIEKLSEVNTNVIKMLAVHEQKVAQVERADADFKKDVERIDKRIDGVQLKIEDIQKTRWIAVGVGILGVILLTAFIQPVFDSHFSKPSHIDTQAPKGP
jgi:hypothetical protein